MKRLLGLFLLLAFLLSPGIVFSSPNDLGLSWWTVDGGGTVPKLSGGPYSLQGTTGQADAGLLSNGRYTLNGGYWNPGVSPPYRVYLPMMLKSS